MVDTIASVANHPNRSNRLKDGPKPAEVRAAREAAGLSQTDAGILVHAPWRTWQNWETEGPEGRAMPPGLWDLFQIKLAARKALEAGQVDARTIKRLAIELPPED